MSHVIANFWAVYLTTYGLTHCCMMEISLMMSWRSVSTGTCLMASTWHCWWWTHWIQSDYIGEPVYSLYGVTYKRSHSFPLPAYWWCQTPKETLKFFFKEQEGIQFWPHPAAWSETPRPASPASGTPCPPPSCHELWQRLSRSVTKSCGDVTTYNLIWNILL